ncbi:hypothetical protein ACFVYF_16655 [Streptomyces sp. NPDC058274]|uniref:hypothetical protein n=1 Tax=Streptomyces sp. NPDC058274 TaxID=3346416 RepID=UPI0036E9F85B
MTQYKMRPRRSFGLVAATVLAGLAITGCGPDASAKKEDKSTKPLKLGDPSPETVVLGSYDTDGKFTVTPKKVFEGKPEDVRELGNDADYAGKKLAWIYVNSKLVGGDKSVKAPMLFTNMGAVAGASGAATRLQLMGSLSSRPKDCVSEDVQITWKQGESHTWCEPFIIPANSHVTQVTYYQDRFKWSVK